MNGGGKERGIWSGTVPTPLVVGFCVACDIAMKEMEYDDKRIRTLRERLFNRIKEMIDGVVLNGSLERKHPGNLNLSFVYVEGESLLMGLKEVAVSSGSACTSASLEPSYVLKALGVEEDMAHSSIRYGIWEVHHGEGNRSGNRVDSAAGREAVGDEPTLGNGEGRYRYQEPYNGHSTDLVRSNS